MPVNLPRSFLLISWFLVATSAAQEAQLQLEVRVFGAESGSGQLLLSVFDSPENYLKVPVLEQNLPVGDNGGAVFVLESMKPSLYAVSVIYDEDNDGELDTGLFGIPKEKIGMSNNAKSTFGPPSFEKTQFELSSSQSIDIFLNSVSD